MRKRPSTSGASVCSIQATPHIQNASVGQKKRLKSVNSSVFIAFWSVLVTVAAFLVFHSSIFNGSGVAVGSVTEEQKVALFVDWFSAAGGNVSSKIVIATFPGMGRGVMALQPVEENDELLCYDTIAKEWNSQPKLKKKLEKLEKDQEELLTAFLLLELAKGSDSRWFPYLQLLPSFSSRNDVASPLLFASDEAVEEMQDERMIKATRHERQRAKQAHGRFKRLFRSFVNNDTLEQTRYNWARFLVNSRAFSIRGQRVMVPFGDIFNGEPDNEARRRDNGQRFLQFHDLQQKGMTIRADRETHSGKQLFEDYGDNSNYVYFLHHGFLMDDRGFDCAAFRLPPLAEAYKHTKLDTKKPDALASKFRVLKRIRVDEAPLACISRAGMLEDPGLVHIYTALYNMDAGQAAVCDVAESFSECFPPEVMSDLDAEPGQQEITLILSSLLDQLERYPTSLVDDLQILNHYTKDGVVSTSNKHAVMFRLSRKQILHDAILMLERQLEQFVKQPEDDNSDDELEAENEFAAESSKLDRFQQWISRHRFPINNLELRYVSESVGYGTFAAKPLASEDIYLSVPLQVVMNVHSALKSPWVRQTFRELQKERRSISREETLLLLHLLEETFGPNRMQSRWKPYLDMLPALDDQGSLFGSPLFYEEGEAQLKSLEGTDLLTLVRNYRQRVSQSYEMIVDNLKQPEREEINAWLSERRFRWANAMLDSRSIWWNSQRHLVPLLDMVNCQELHLEHKPHHTNLDSSGRHAITKASWDYEAGQEVVENYAQPNYIYLLYHGFVLDSNSHDCAHFHLQLPAVARQREFSSLLRSLELYSLTPDVCVSPADEASISRFAKIAHFVADSKEAFHQASTRSASPQAILAALDLVEERRENLKTSNPEASGTGDFRTQSIHRYRSQQLQHLTELHDILHEMGRQQQN
ncbi:unnamed protein product [Phytophthora lilii]|uniref:Unnamed protein product n=1 Tax=Phytophthora lilii TaxID=2077276 RepID=A0A9W6TLE6_9STRA|nr:unnamed protein product [Phytophthora lilii]